MKTKQNNRLIAGLKIGRNLAGLGSLLLTCSLARAGNLYWDANGATAGSGNSGAPWEGSNWTTDSTGAILTGPWVNGESAVFSAGTDGTGDWAVTLSSTVTVASILFKETANLRTFNGGTINIGGGTINSTVNGVGADGNNARDVIMNSLLAGSGGLTIAAHGSHLANNGGGGSEFRLGNAGNSFSGGLTISNGLVSWLNNGGLGAASNIITLNGGGLLYGDTTITLPRTIQVGANGGTIRLYGDRNVYFTGTLSNVSGVATTMLRRTDAGTLRIYGSMSGYTGTFLNGGGATHFLAPNADLSGTDLQSEGGAFSMNGGGTAVVNKITSGNDFNIDNGTTVNVDAGTIVLTGGGFYRTNVGALGKLTSSSGTLTFASGAASGSLTTGNPTIQVQIVNSGVTPVSLVKTNVGNLVLNQPNTYSGTTTVNAGRIDLKNPGGFGSGAVTVNSGGQAYLNCGLPVTNNFTINGNGPTEGTSFGALRFGSPSVLSGSLSVASASRVGADTNIAGTIAGTLTGTAALEKTGAGTVAITGNAAGYSGAVTVSTGILSIGTTLPSSVSVADAAIVAGEGTIGGGLTLGSDTGAFITMNPNTPGALTTTNLALNGVATVRLTESPTSGSTVDVIKHTGSVTLPDEVAYSFVLENGSQYRSLPVFADSGTAITLTMSPGADLLWVGNVDGNWDLITSNWLDGAASDTFHTGDNVTFDDSGLIKIVPMSGKLSPASITINNSAGNDYTIGTNTAAHGFTGPVNIIKNGTGTVNIQGYGSDYTGTVTINDGVFKAGAANEVLGNTSGVTINDSANGGGQFDINGQNIGMGVRHYSLTIAGDGPNNLGAITNSGAGGPNGNAGLLNVTLSADAGVGGNGGRFDIGNSGSLFGAIKGNGFTLTKVGTGIVTARGPASNITYAVAAGTLKFEDYNSASGTNPITVNGGTLAAYGPRTFANTLNFADATKLDNDGGGSQVWTGPINLTGVAGSNVTFTARGGALQVDGAISGASNVSVTNTGTNVLYLTGAASNTYTGSTTFTGTVTAATNGQLVLGKTGGAVAIPGDLYLIATGNKGVVSTIENNQFGANSVVRFSGAFDNRLELKGTTQTVAGIDNSGTLTGYYNAIQHSEFGSPAQMDGVSDLILNVAESNSFTYSGVLRDLGGTVNIVKSGAGTQTLLGNGIDFRGTTSVTEGRLIVNSDDSWTSVLNVSANAIYEVNITSTTEPFENRYQGFTLTGVGTYTKTGPGAMSMGWGDGTTAIMATVAMDSGAMIDIQGGMMRFDYGRQTSWTHNKSDLNVASGATMDLWDNNTDGIIVDALTGGGAIIRTKAETGNLTVGVDNGSGEFAGFISNSSGTTNLIKQGSGTQTLSGSNNYTGNTTVNGGTLELAYGGLLVFLVKDTTSNKITGTGAVTLNGSFYIDTIGVTVKSGSWTLVDTSTLDCTFGPDFSPGIGWTKTDDVWTSPDNLWTFSETSGVLTLIASDTYASWIDGYFPGVGDPLIIGAGADPDHDGIANAVEMVTGGNPATGMDAALLPTLELVTDPAGLATGEYFLFTYRRTDLSVAAGLIANCETDADLVGPWTIAQDGVGGVVVLEDDNYASFEPAATADTDRVRVFIQRGANVALFGHLKVQVP